MNLILKPLPGGAFEYISGDRSDFQKLVDLQNFYDNQTTKNPITIEEGIWLAGKVSRVVDGPEQGMYSHDQWINDLRELQNFFSERGYGFWNRAL